MSGEEEQRIQRLETEVAQLREALAEVAVGQAEALNALSRHLKQLPTPSGELLGVEPSALTASQQALQAARRSLEIAAKLLV